MPVIPLKETNFMDLPTRTPLLAKVLESEFVNEKNPFFGKVDKKGKTDTRETRDVIKVKMVATEEPYHGQYIWKTFGASINEKSALRPFIQCCSDRELTIDELKRFNTDTLVGRYVCVIGEYSETDTEHKFLQPTSYVRPTARQIKDSEEAAEKRKSAPRLEPVGTSAKPAGEIEF